MIDFTCGCGFRSQVKDELAGKKIKCPNCSRIATLPSSVDSSGHFRATPATQPNLGQYPNSPEQFTDKKKIPMKRYALIIGVIVIVIIGVIALALNRVPNTLEGNNRDDIYNQYLQKSEAFFDSLFRTSSDLEVGINHLKFQERIQDMNFQYNKWAESLTTAETLYPSAQLMVATLNCYLASQQHWQDKIDTQNKTHAQWSETCMQNEWRKATVILSWAKLCHQNSDAVERQDCILCEGSGELSCPVCKGTGKCPVCRGSVDYNIPCPFCGKPPFTTGNCSFCRGTGEYNTHCGQCVDGRCIKCSGKGVEECPVCNGTGSFPPWERTQ